MVSTDRIASQSPPWLEAALAEVRKHLLAGWGVERTSEALSKAVREHQDADS